MNIRIQTLRTAKLIVLSVALLTCAGAFGTSITLHGTGFDSSGNPLNNGAVDAWWTLNNNPVDHTHNAYFIAPGGADWWSGYAGNTNAPGFQGSGWISTNATSTYNGPGPYTFSMTFSLAGLDLNTVSISGLWSIADGGTLDINGHVIDTLSGISQPWTSLHSYTINNPAYLLQGINTIDITVSQSDSYYETARFEGTVTGTNLPEPSSLALLGTGIAGLAGLFRRHLIG